MYKIIDGNKISKEMLSESKKKADDLLMMNKKVTMADIIVGDDPASNVYINNKSKKFLEVGVNFKLYKLDINTSENELIELIEKLNNDKDINAIFLEMPLPKSINQNKVVSHISPKKDVDGFYINGYFPCTAEGIVELIKRSNISIEGKNCVVIGRSNIVGKPVALLMLNENATVTICHSKTKNLKEICKTADILIVATRNPKGIDDTYIKNGAVVIDVGIHRTMVSDKTIICGDVDFDKVAPHTSYITPVPGGVGPMTVAVLLKHCLDTLNE